MNPSAREKGLKISLIAFGVICFLIYPASLIWFTIVSSVVDAAIMAVQAIMDEHEHGHLVGDVPALLLVAVVFWYFLPKTKVASNDSTKRCCRSFTR